jgi:mRNA interferase MazF
VRRGEVWSSAGGQDYAGKPRPCVVIQSNAYNATNSVTICLLTSTVTLAAYTRPLIEPDDANGLNVPSRAVVDKLTTLPREKLGRQLGRLSDNDVTRLDTAILIFLGLA